MIRRTFQHFPGVRQRTESTLWASGIDTWASLRGYHPPRVEMDAFNAAIDDSERAYAAGDIAYFGRVIPSRESWRVYHEYHEYAGYLDIETTGEERDSNSITCIALATKRDGVKTFVKGRNLADFEGALRDVPLLVTFNGAAFDLLFLAKTFGSELIESRAHFDTCTALRRLGHGGGLKKIEKDLGVPRERGLDGLNGASAIWLWYLHEIGDPRALPTLERYCSEDVLGLPALAAMACNELVKDTPFAKCVEPLFVPRRVESYLPYSRELVLEIMEDVAARDEKRR